MQDNAGKQIQNPTIYNPLIRFKQLFNPFIGRINQANDLFYTYLCFKNVKYFFGRIFFSFLFACMVVYL